MRNQACPSWWFKYLRIYNNFISSLTKGRPNMNKIILLGIASIVSTQYSAPHNHLLRQIELREIDAFDGYGNMASMSIIILIWMLMVYGPKTQKSGQHIFGNSTQNSTETMIPKLPQNSIKCHKKGCVHWNSHAFTNMHFPISRSAQIKKLKKTNPT